MLYCSHQIRVKGDDETYPFKDVMYATPWPDLVQVPGQTWEERLELMTSDSTIMPDGTVYKNYWDHADYDFRVFKSHNTPEQFGDLIAKDSNSKVKFLAMARNGLDQVASATPFFDKHDARFRKMWGGFPPADGGAGDKRREVASERLQQMLPGNVFGAWHFDYINSWWKVKDQKNVLLLHFSDAKKDLKGTISKIADFYGVRLNEQEKNKITEKCSFDYMKKNGDLFLYSLPLNPDYDGKVMAKGSMTRKGAVGEGAALFSDEGTCIYVCGVCVYCIKTQMQLIFLHGLCIYILTHARIIIKIKMIIIHVYTALEKQLWEKAEQDQFGDDPEKLNWARNGGGFTSN